MLDSGLFPMAPEEQSSTRCLPFRSAYRGAVLHSVPCRPFCLSRSGARPGDTLEFLTPEEQRSTRCLPFRSAYRGAALDSGLVLFISPAEEQCSTRGYSI